MKVKFRNPWVDPRVVEVRPQAAQAYLVAQGWKPVGPVQGPRLLRFERPSHGEETPTVLVPVELDQGPLLQRMIDLVGDLARLEGRWAVDVLSDILRQPLGPAPGNALNAPTTAETAPK